MDEWNLVSSLVQVMGTCTEREICRGRERVKEMVKKMENGEMLMVRDIINCVRKMST